MVISAPKIDERTATQIAGQVQGLLETYAPAWQEFDPNTRKPHGVSAALINIFARFAELIIQRLNQAPDKNFLAFLDLLGVSLLPPQPARVPLTFSLAAGSAVDGLVPAGTQVAAPPAEGEKEPAIFETERELVVTAAQLAALFARDPEQDKYADHSAILATAASSEMLVFKGDSPIEHILYIGHDSLLSHTVLKELRLNFALEKNIENPKPRTLQWEIWDSVKGITITPRDDETANLTIGGEVIFDNLAQFPRQTVNAVTSRWLRCRLKEPITLATGLVGADQLPLIKTITMQAELDRRDLVVDAAFSNLLPIDPSKDFFPFGEKPKPGDALYLANAEAFSQREAVITFNVSLANPAGGKTSSIPPVKASDDLKLKWEFWSGKSWTELGTATPREATAGESKIFEDTTKAFTNSGYVKFMLPRQPVAQPVNGAENFWIRVRIVAGDYGKEARYELIDPNKPETGYKLIPATFAPPVIANVAVDYSLSKSATAPETVLAYNDFVYEDFTKAQFFAPFQATKDRQPSCYLGFTLPPERASFPNRAISLYLRLADIIYGQTADNPSPSSSPRLVWEYWNDQDWTKLTVRDETEALTHPGLLEFLGPADFAQRNEFGLKAYWLRVRWESGEYKFAPRWKRLLLNTTVAAQTVTIRNEILGSSNGSEQQKFRTIRAPVLPKQQLEVREPEMPSAEELAALEKEEGADTISQTDGITGRPKEIWVRWHEVMDFYASSPRDWHYVLDHLTGEVRFGDGINGLVPPAGTGNIRMTRYQSGGGTTGNKPAGTIVQLKTTVPYVEKVTNTEAASGGADAEMMESLLERGPRTVRHGGRAVTFEDYEDLAILASPEVARAKCVPLSNLTEDPDATELRPGAVSIIVVPRSKDAKPVPGLELINRVRDYIDAYRLPNAELVVVGPEYLRVDVEAEIALTTLEGASAVELAIVSTLAKFLHPLTGGLNGEGWAFGRQPHKSDLYALLEAVPGVDHVRSLIVKKFEDRPDKTEKTGRFLVYSGAHKINLVFEEE